MSMLSRVVRTAIFVPLAFSVASCAQTQTRARTTSVDSIATASIPSSRPPVKDRNTILTMQAAVRRAVDYQPSIMQAAGELNQQGAAIRDARSGYFPSIGGGIDVGRRSAFGNGFQPAATVTASQMIYDFGKVSSQVASATATEETRRAEFIAVVDNVIRDTALASLETLRNRSLAVVASDQVRDTKEILELVNARTEQGASTRSDKLQAEARVQMAQTTALEIRSQSERWQGSMASLLGMSGKINLGASIPSDLPNACSAKEPDWGTVPSVRAAASKKTAAEANLRFSKADVLPTLALEGGSSMDLLGNSPGSPDYTIGLKLTGKLYNGGSYKARSEAGQFAVQSAEAGIANARTGAQRSWMESRTQLSGMRALLTTLASRQTLMRETRDLYQRQFLDLGTRTLLDVLNADQELHAARFDAINIQFDVHKLNIECASAAGRLRDIFKLEKKPGTAATVLNGGASRSETPIEMAVTMPARQALPIEAGPAAAENAERGADVETELSEALAVSLQASSISADVKDKGNRFEELALRGAL